MVVTGRLFLPTIGYVQCVGIGLLLSYEDSDEGYGPVNLTQQPNCLALYLHPLYSYDR